MDLQHHTAPRANQQFVIGLW